MRVQLAQRRIRNNDNYRGGFNNRGLSNVIVPSNTVPSQVFVAVEVIGIATTLVQAEVIIGTIAETMRVVFAVSLFDEPQIDVNHHFQAEEMATVETAVVTVAPALHTKSSFDYLKRSSLVVFFSSYSYALMRNSLHSSGFALCFIHNSNVYIYIRERLTSTHR